MTPDLQAMAKFWSRVKIPKHRYWRTVCWEWTGAVSKDDAKSKERGFSGGHGCLRVDGKWKKAHRHAWELVHGPLAPGENVLHTCDNRCCVNVFEHLYVGTLSQNMQDTHDRGRSTGKQKGGNVREETCPECGALIGGLSALHEEHCHLYEVPF